MYFQINAQVNEVRTYKVMIVTARMLLDDITRMFNKTVALPSTTVAPPVEPVCTNGKLFGTCGTACPLSCDNYRNPPTGCIDECFVGCFCPTGLVELNDGCVPPH